MFLRLMTDFARLLLRAGFLCAAILPTSFVFAQSMVTQLQMTVGGGTTGSASYNVQGSLQSFSQDALPASTTYRIAPASLASELPTVPGAPQITGIEPGNTQVSISVSVADDGGSPITSYTGACFGDSIFFGTSATSPITVSGLTNGESYVCAVIAINDVGAGPAAVSAPFTPVAPAPGC
jgi:hypothetical protein